MLYKHITKIKVPSTATLSVKQEKTWASWRNRTGKRISAEVKADSDGRQYVSIESKFWYCRYTDSTGHRIQRSTKCTDRSAALAVMNEWVKVSERVKAGILRQECEQTGRLEPKLFKKVQQEYLEALSRGWSKNRKETRPASIKHLSFSKYVLDLFREQSKINRLIDFTCEKTQKYINSLQEQGKSARYRNHHRSILSGFASFCQYQNYLSDNPVSRTTVANVKLDIRRKPRALTEQEVSRLLTAAMERPLNNFLNGNTGAVSIENVDPKIIDELKRTGRQRRLIYLTLWRLGLRWSELRNVCIRDIDLKNYPEHILLKANGTKAKREEKSAVPEDLKTELQAWIVDEGRIGATKLFDMSASGGRIFDKDLAAAKIPKQTHEGIACPHSLRHSLGTRLGKSGTPIAVTKSIMRHADIRTTMDYYTHLTLIDAHQALERLPTLPDAFVDKELKILKLS